MTKHTHDFQPREQKVLLGRYRVEEGESGMQYVLTSGADILKQLACACGEVVTYDLVRTVAHA